MLVSVLVSVANFGVSDCFFKSSLLLYRYISCRAHAFLFEEHSNSSFYSLKSELLEFLRLCKPKASVYVFAYYLDLH